MSASAGTAGASREMQSGGGGEKYRGKIQVNHSSERISVITKTPSRNTEGIRALAL